MASVPGTTNETTPAPGEPFCFSFLWKSWSSLHRYFEPSRSHNWITVWLFSTQVIPNAASDSVVTTSPQEYQPHVDPSPSSPVRSSSPSSLARSSSVSSSSPRERSEASNPPNMGEPPKL
jgi:hypothetical protein